MSYYENPPDGKWPGVVPQQPPWRIALITNRATAERPPGSNQRRRVEALVQALEMDGHWVHLCPADQTLPEALLNLQPHICFNAIRMLPEVVDEGRLEAEKGAWVAALCELLAFPYTASRPLAGGLAADKIQSNRIWRSLDLPTPSIQASRLAEEPLGPDRIFKVGFIGNRGPAAARQRPSLYDSSGYHFFPVLELELETGRLLTGSGSVAAIGETLHGRLLLLARQAAEALAVCDAASVEIGLDAAGEPHLLALNAYPDLDPLTGELALMASVEGIPYQTLVGEILHLAAERWHLPFRSSAARRAATSSVLGEPGVC